MTLIIRPAEPADTPHILRLIRALAEYERLLQHVTVTEDQLRAALFGPQPKAEAVLAEIDQAPVGLALFYYTFSTFSARPSLFLEDLFVDPIYRGHGIGLALMRHLAQRAVTEDCFQVEWKVLEWNQPAIDFYQRLGAERMRDWHTRQLAGDALRALAKGASDG